MIEPEALQQIDRTYVVWRRRRLSYFSGCDYFRLSSHPRLRAGLLDGLRRYGLTVSASRLTTGNHVLYSRLEARLANFLKAEAVLLMADGYVTNLAVAQALAGQFSHALIDEAAHPSLCDAAGLLECPVLRFRHRSASDLGCLAGRCGPGSKLIVLTDGLFARDGAAAPLSEYLAGLPRDAVLLVDDAHGAGILGAHGRGSLEHTGVARRQIIQTITLSKALGGFGGAILGTKTLRRTIVQRSRLFMGSTPLPLPLASAALEALNVLASEPKLRTRLFSNASYVRNGLRQCGILVPETPGPIIALECQDARSIARVKRSLLERGIYPPLIKYAGGPATGYLRFVFSSEHRREQLDALLKALAPHATFLSAAF